ncbi:hypothetical protein ACFQ7B_32615 [Streptomyces erythrochromogenes]
MRDAGFVGSEQCVRQMWRALMAKEPRRAGGPGDESEADEAGEEADAAR